MNEQTKPAFFNPGHKSLWKDHWDFIIEAMGIQGLLKQIADNCVIRDWDDEYIELYVDESQRSLYQKRHELELQKRIQQLFGSEIDLRIYFKSLTGILDKAMVVSRQKERSSQGEQSEQHDSADVERKAHMLSHAIICIATASNQLSNIFLKNGEIFNQDFWEVAEGLDKALSYLSKCLGLPLSD